MTFSANWSGKGNNCPKFLDLVTPPIDSLGEAEADHAHHIGHLVDHWTYENFDSQLSLSVVGYVTGQQRSLSLNVTATDPEPEPAAEPPNQGADVDSSISGDPFAPEGTQPQAKPAVEGEGGNSGPEPAPEPAAGAAPPQPEPEAVPAEPAGTEPQAEPASDSPTSDDVTEPEQAPEAAPVQEISPPADQPAPVAPDNPDEEAPDGLPAA